MFGMRASGFVLGIARFFTCRLLDDLEDMN